jgi:hypothetical protein
MKEKIILANWILRVLLNCKHSEYGFRKTADDIADLLIKYDIVNTRKIKSDSIPIDVLANWSRKTIAKRGEI